MSNSILQRLISLGMYVPLTLSMQDSCCILTRVIIIIGTLIPIHFSLSGLGGGAEVQIACSGCCLATNYASSAMCDGLQRHTVVTVALRLGAFISGIGFAGYHKLFRRYLGLNTVTKKNSLRRLRWPILMSRTCSMRFANWAGPKCRAYLVLNLAAGIVQSRHQMGAAYQGLLQSKQYLCDSQFPHRCTPLVWSCFNEGM